MGRPNLPEIHGRYAMAKRTSDSLITITGHVITWQALVGLDPEGVFDIGGGAPTRITVPADWNLVELVTSVLLTGFSGASSGFSFLTKNGIATFDGRDGERDDQVLSGGQFQTIATTAPLVVVPGDFFEMGLNSGGGITATLTGSTDAVWAMIRRLG